MADETVLPTFTAEQFDLKDAPECDAIMKGGITSGIVYPYAILEIATKYRFRSLGGTSAGAIAAAFAAAAEYARGQGRPEAYMTLKHYCDALPEQLHSLFQPDPAFAPAEACLRGALAKGSLRAILASLAKAALPWALLGAAALGLASLLAGSSTYATVLAALLGLLSGFGLALFLLIRARYVRPLTGLVDNLPGKGFGICPGLTQPGRAHPGLTDWIHRALQDIAFGDPEHEKPLTFGDLEGPDPARPLVSLRMVTTNLSMGRPHTLPRLGTDAGFFLEEWQRLFPAPVLKHMCASSKRWSRLPTSWLFPAEQDLPVLVGVRMSLRFPLLISAVPLWIRDTELASVAASLGGKAEIGIRPAWFSDGGISSNFPIHIFDAMLPTRPTFAFSLEKLQLEPGLVKRRVTLPETASDGMGVQISEIRSLKDFGWQILASAKDWQDQLLSGISGQRERIARIYLANREGGLNLDMPAAVSRDLMLWGYEAGRKFTSDAFDFDEHRWRRLLVLYKNLRRTLGQAESVWDGGFDRWYEGYFRQVKSYKSVTLAQRRMITEDMNRVLAECRAFADEAATEAAVKHMPQRSGTMKVAPKY
jgi:predicted acylesterase/phospholipase RssA